MVGEGPLVGQEGWADLVQGGSVGRPWGLWGEQWGRWGGAWSPSLSGNVTSHVGRSVVGGCPWVLPIHWQLSRRGHQGWSGALDFLCGSQRAGW